MQHLILERTDYNPQLNHNPNIMLYANLTSISSYIDSEDNNNLVIKFSLINLLSFKGSELSDISSFIFFVEINNKTVYSDKVNTNEINIFQKVKEINELSIEILNYLNIIYGVKDLEQNILFKTYSKIRFERIISNSYYNTSNYFSIKKLTQNSLTNNNSNNSNNNLVDKFIIQNIMFLNSSEHFIKIDYLMNKIYLSLTEWINFKEFILILTSDKLYYKQDLIYRIRVKNNLDYTNFNLNITEETNLLNSSNFNISSEVQKYKDNMNLTSNSNILVNILFILFLI